VLNEDQREIRDLIRALSRERIAPRAAEIDKSSEFPWDVVELFREHDVFGIMFDEEYGGAGASALMTLVAIEEVSKVCATSGLILAVQELGSLGIKLAGSEEQKRRFLPRLASGEWLPAYALTEPGSGSDSAAMRSEARRDGEEYVLNGSKRFITNAGVAGLYLVFAKTDPGAGHAGISAFVVEADTPGFEVGRIEPKMGIKGSTTGELFFNDMRVPANNLLGEEGEGFRIAMRILDRDERQQRPRAEPAVLLVEEQAEEVVLAEQLDHVPRKLVRLVDRRCPRSDSLARKLPDEVAKLALLVAQRLIGHAESLFSAAYSGWWQTASMLWPFGSCTKAA